MAHWAQIKRHFTKPALVAGALYCRLLRIRRRLQCWLGLTGRTWTWTYDDRPPYYIR